MLIPYASVSVMVNSTSDEKSNGILYMQFSHNGNKTHKSITMNIDDVIDANPRSISTMGKYFRIIYVNLSVPMTSTDIQTIFYLTQAALVSRLEQVIDGASDIENIRSIVAGRDSYGRFRNNPTDHQGHLQIRIHNPLSAFGDLRTVGLIPMLALTFPYTVNDKLLTKSCASGGIVTIENNMLVLNSGTQNDGFAKIESRNILKYRSCLGALARFTGLFIYGIMNCFQMLGIDNDEDGFFVGCNGSTFGVMVRRNKIDTWISQKNWNIDTYDGTKSLNNPSGIKMNIIKINVFQIEFQWLGAGAINFYVENSNTGEFDLNHCISHANQHLEPSIYNANLPFHMSVTNNGNTDNIIFKSASVGLFEGKNIMTGPIASHGCICNTISINKESQLFCLRNVCNFSQLDENLSIKNRTIIYLKEMSVANDTHQLCYFKLCLNSVFKEDDNKKNKKGHVHDNNTWSNVDGTNSVVQMIESHNMESYGDLFFQSVVGNNEGKTIDLSNHNLFMIPGDVLTVTVITRNVNSMGIILTWQEDY